MFACRHLTVRSPEGSTLLDGVSATFPDGQLSAIIGPSGCGKTTLVKAMLGLMPSAGNVFYDGQAISGAQALAGRVGFAPQFSIAQPKLTVEEVLRYSLELFVAEASSHRPSLEAILQTVGLIERRHTRVEALSGGQLRRLGMGLELTLDPACLVCDEVTSGLDPNSEDEILALMDTLRRTQGKTFLCIIHNLAKLEAFDWITVVNAGSVVFQGDLAELCAYFGIPDALHLYDVLKAQPPEHWRDRWAYDMEPKSCGAAVLCDASGQNRAPTVSQPSPGSQLTTLLRRRLRLLCRDRGYLWLTLAITLGFPCLVVIFALDGLPQIQGLALDRGDMGLIEALQQSLQFQITQMQTAQLVTGLILFQVILLTLMGANNGGREIAAERLLYEKERFCGLRPLAYAGSKIVFTGLLALVQGLWMTSFVKVICAFPGPWLAQAAILCGVCLAMSWICLGFSALCQSAEKASLLSIYLVGFQLPLSGVVLALPDALVWLCRPFITTYWGWAGYMSTMRETRLYDAFRQQNTDWVAAPSVAWCVLIAQALLGIGLVIWGCRKHFWK